MDDIINNKNTSVNDAEKLFDFLIDMLEYRNSSNFHAKKGEGFDATYSIKIEKKEYTIIGIKISKEKNEESILKQHLQYWNENKVPFSILIFPDEIRIYNNFTINKNKLLYTSKQKNDNVISVFSNKNILNGLFWEKYYSVLKNKDRVDTFLLNNLKNTIVDLFKNYKMNIEDAYNFLAQCIFIKYMEDRQMLTKSAFDSYGIENFNQLLDLENVEMIKSFFSKLKEWFNGDLFELDNINWPTKEQLKVIKSFFSADEIYANGTIQYTLIKYDFSKIPIELISNIYEMIFNLEDQLLNKDYSSKNGAYYTPYYLADFMNDRCLERYHWQHTPVVLDPACGSGVFLVGAFKRIVEHTKKTHGQISQDELHSILTNNIYGIDKNLKALKLSCFSLYIALLEYLTPKDILINKFKFPNLIGTTLLCSNFFEKALDKKNIQADIIVGNPPWLSDKIDIHNLYCKERNIPISDGQLAQAFMTRAKDFANTNSIISLIVTNSIFTNENAKAYRKYLLDNFEILEVFNLYKIRTKLFSHANAPCSIITYKNTKKEENYSFLYYSFTSNMISEIFNKIVYDKGESFKINSNVILNKDYIWRILNNGDEYDVRVVNKINLHPTIQDRGYQYFRGYAVGRKTFNKPEFLNYKGGNLQEGYNQYMINYDVLPQITDDKFERPRKLELYLCKNKLLIKRTQNLQLSGAAFCEKPVIFTDDYHCLYTFDDFYSDDLKILSAFINSSIFEYYQYFVTKAESSIKPEISKNDILSFPVPENIEDQKREAILDNIAEIEVLLKERFEKDIFENYVIEEIEDKIDSIKQDINRIVFETYHLDEVEQATIDYARKYIIPKVNTKKRLLKNCYENDVYEKYSGYIVKYFNNFLSDSQFYLKCVNIDSKNIFTLVSFKVFNANAPDNIVYEDNLLENLVDILGISSLENINSELTIKNKISGFLNDGFFIIKANEMKNWTLMSAIKDAEYFAKIILRENIEEDLYDNE